MKAILTGLLLLNSISSYADTLTIYSSEIEKIDVDNSLIVAKTTLVNQKGKKKSVKGVSAISKDCINLATKLALSSSNNYLLQIKINKPILVANEIAYVRGNTQVYKKSCSIVSKFRATF